MPEKGGGIRLRNLAQCEGDRLGERFGRSCADAAQHALDFRDRQFDWRQVWRVGRHKPQSAAALGQQLGNLRHGVGTYTILYAMSVGKSTRMS
jgi:hypothetical protein